jgi:6-phosphogluconate dehydrogenase
LKNNDFSNGKVAIMNNSHYQDTIYQIKQYNETKKILNHLSFEYRKRKKVLNCSIISDLSCELKRERKMMMALRDTNEVNYYASVDLKKA